MYGTYVCIYTCIVSVYSPYVRICTLYMYIPYAETLSTTYIYDIIYIYTCIYPSPYYINLHVYIALSSHPKHTEWPQDAIRILNQTLVEKGEYAVYTAAMHKLDERLSVLKNGGVDVQGEIMLLRALRNRVHEVRVRIMTFSCVYLILLYCNIVLTLILVFSMRILFLLSLLAYDVLILTASLICIIFTLYGTMLYYTIPHYILYYTIPYYTIYLPYTLYTTYAIDLPITRAPRSLPLTIIQR